MTWVTADHECCGGSCRRKHPIAIRRGGFSGRWFAVTRYIVKGDTLEAIEKHDITIELNHALIEHGWTPPFGEGPERVS